MVARILLPGSNSYAQQVAESLEAERRRAIQFMRPGFVPQSDGQAQNLVQVNGVPGNSELSPLTQPVPLRATFSDRSSSSLTNPQSGSASKAQPASARLTRYL